MEAGGWGPRKPAQAPVQTRSRLSVTLSGLCVGPLPSPLLSGNPAPTQGRTPPPGDPPRLLQPGGWGGPCSCWGLVLGTGHLPVLSRTESALTGGCSFCIRPTRAVPSGCCRRYTSESFRNKEVWEGLPLSPATGANLVVIIWTKRPYVAIGAFLPKFFQYLDTTRIVTWAFVI